MSIIHAQKYVCSCTNINWDFLPAEIYNDPSRIITIDLEFTNVADSRRKNSIHLQHTVRDIMKPAPTSPLVKFIAPPCFYTIRKQSIAIQNNVRTSIFVRWGHILFMETPSPTTFTITLDTSNPVPSGYFPPTVHVIASMIQNDDIVIQFNTPIHNIRNIQLEVTIHYYDDLANELITVKKYNSTQLSASYNLEISNNYNFNIADFLISATDLGSNNWMEVYLRDDDHVTNTIFVVPEIKNIYNNSMITIINAFVYDISSIHQPFVNLGKIISTEINTPDPPATPVASIPSPNYHFNATSANATYVQSIDGTYHLESYTNFNIVPAASASSTNSLRVGIDSNTYMVTLEKVGLGADLPDGVNNIQQYFNAITPNNDTFDISILAVFRNPTPNNIRWIKITGIGNDGAMFGISRYGGRNAIAIQFNGIVITQMIPFEWNVPTRYIHLVYASVNKDDINSEYKFYFRLISFDHTIEPHVDEIKSFVLPYASITSYKTTSTGAIHIGIDNTITRKMDDISHLTIGESRIYKTALSNSQRDYIIAKTMYDWQIGLFNIGSNSIKNLYDEHGNLRSS